MAAWRWRLAGRSSRAGALRARLASRPSSPRLETLEDRLLLSGLPSDSTAEVSAVVPMAGAPALPVLVSSAPRPDGRVDTFLLPASDGWPEVLVEVSLAAGAGAPSGTLRVFDACGATLGLRALGDSGPLQASFEIPDGQDVVLLDVDVATRPASPDGAGSYRITIDWDQANLDRPETLNVPPSGGSTVFIGASGLGSSPPPPSAGPPAVPSPYTAVFDLPAPIVIATPAPIAADPISGGRTGSNLPVGPPDLPASPPSTTSPQGPAPSPSPRSPVAASPRSAGDAAPSSADRGRPSYVGPLPLGPSTADGGLFARGAGPIAPAGIQAPANSEVAAVALLGVAWANPREATSPEVAPSASIGPGPRPVGRWPFPVARGRGDRPEGGPAAEGSAFLPRLALLAGPAPEGVGKVLKAPASGPRRRGRLAIIPAGLAASATVLLGLAGPGLAGGLPDRARRRRDGDLGSPRA